LGAARLFCLKKTEEKGEKWEGESGGPLHPRESKLKKKGWDGGEELKIERDYSRSERGGGSRGLRKELADKVRKKRRG